jgi:5-methylcytosine-specific restriction endonuclease McrA
VGGWSGLDIAGIVVDMSAEDKAHPNATSEPAEELTDEQAAAIADALAESRDLFARMADVMADLQRRPHDVDEFMDARAEIGVLFAEANERAGRVAAVFGLRSAQARLMHYLHLHIAEPVAGAALAGVSCIWEWARRSRELDVEHGWKIEVGRNDELGLAQGEYMLTTEERDEAMARDWQRLNRIRQTKGSGGERMLRLLISAHPEPVTREDLDYVSKIRSRDRRKRDLQEAGWRISSYEEDPSLQHGEYRLDDINKGPPRAREAIKLRQEILERDGFTCQQCGARPEPGRRIILHIHHKKFVRHDGTNHPDNLETLCRQCHAGKHAVAEARVDDELLNPAANPYLTEAD